MIASPESVRTGAPNESVDNPLTLETWLSAIPHRRVLLLAPGSAAASGKIERLIQDIRQHDSQALTGKDSDQDLILFKVGPADSGPGEDFSLPYETGQFDLAICAYTSTAMVIERDTLIEINRVVEANCHLLVIDYLVPGSRLRGKKARQSREAGEYVNAWMRLRNPRHISCLSLDAWAQQLKATPWNIEQTAEYNNLQAFDAWSDDFALTSQDRIRLRAMLIQAPEKVERFLTPLGSGDRIVFRLTELTILAAA